MTSCGLSPRRCLLMAVDLFRCPIKSFHLRGNSKIGLMFFVCAIMGFSLLVYYMDYQHLYTGLQGHGLTVKFMHGQNMAGNDTGIKSQESSRSYIQDMLDIQKKLKDALIVQGVLLRKLNLSTVPEGGERYPEGGSILKNMEGLGWDIKGDGDHPEILGERDSDFTNVKFKAGDTAELESSIKGMEKIYKERSVNCAEVFNDRRSKVMEEAVKIANTTKGYQVPVDFYTNLTQSCPKFIKSRGYINHHLTEDELNFPLAFSIVGFKDIEMLERLLRSIYRPQNSVCIHIDIKSDPTFFKAVNAITDCFPNVFLAPRRVDVRWAKFTVLEPELICMEALWSHKQWKYFINLTGQEFPLKTNLELVKILTAYNGANDLEGTIRRANKDRWKRGPPPHNIRPVKGSVHITVNRDFVDYILHNQIAKDLLEWVKNKSGVPDETYFATLNHNPQLGIRGSYAAEPPETHRTYKPFLTRFKDWGHIDCHGPRARGICIWATGDLPTLRDQPHLFVNKFHIDKDRLVIGCMEELLYNRTRDGFLGKRIFDTTYYKNLGFVKNQVFKQPGEKR